MKSPFPGMDPYLELHWRDVHQSLAVYARDQLQAKLPGDLIARVEEQVYVEPHDMETRGRILYPDVRVTEHEGRGAELQVDGGIAVEVEVVAEPIVIYLPEPATEAYIEIREAGARQRLITVIEILSHSNKATPKGRKKYRAKQDELEESDVNLVEIDLLRRGTWIMCVPKSLIPTARRALYGVCVRRSWQAARLEFYPLPLRQRLPSIRIPLREKDEDVTLNLQSLVDQCYANGRYDSIDYSADLKPPFDATDAAWLNDLLKSAGRR
jgi:hypothetical protein